jgi:hypothetical protein
VTVIGTAAKLSTGESGEPFVEFDYTKESVVAWQ